MPTDATTPLKIGQWVRFASDPDGFAHRVVSVMSDGMIEIHDYDGYFAPHLFVSAEDVGDVPAPATAPPAAALPLTAEPLDADAERLIRDWINGGNPASLVAEQRLFATLDAERAAREAAENRENAALGIVRQYMIAIEAAERERDQWRTRENETQGALQAIGEEFGFHGGEPRVAGTRRVLTELRARAEATERRVRELEALVERAYNEGLIEGMREITTYAGGKPWRDSKAAAALAARAEGA